MEEIIKKDDEFTGCSGNCGKLDVCDWLSDLPKSYNTTDFVEVQFKNTRKGFYKNSNELSLTSGDIVAVEASPGHDIGTVTLTGELVLLQMKKNNVSPETFEFKRIYRKAKAVDIDKWKEARAQEQETMLESRNMAMDLNLNMKIGDVEYQGDGTKAIFYYIADERVDFRQLIKVLAERFRVRIEMRQIGARQEAGRIGGIGPCGRELCCSSWMSSFVSVTTQSARYQEISLNPQKLAGQCGKLKCCLNYELNAYLDAQSDFPDTSIPLETTENRYFHFKTDIFKHTMWYSTERGIPVNLLPISVDRVKEVIEINKNNKRVDQLQDAEFETGKKEPDYHNVIEQESLTRFDDKKGSKRRKNRPRKFHKRSNNSNKDASNNKNKNKN